MVLLESGATVPPIAEHRQRSCRPIRRRARATSWMFAALNSVEPSIMFLIQIDLKFADDGAAMRVRDGAVDVVNGRLQSAAAWLDGRNDLEDQFTAGDLLMATVHVTGVRVCGAAEIASSACTSRRRFHGAQKLNDHES